MLRASRRENLANPARRRALAGNAGNIGVRIGAETIGAIIYVVGHIAAGR
jgi:hypothetical protein